ncbi:MAG: class I SAM-dependent methyltransferase [Acidimicrobiales bacterium]
MIRLDIDLTPEEIEAISETNADDWFTKVAFRNAESPTHPRANILEPNNTLKKEMLLDWVEKVVPNASVLDTFAANGGWSILAAQLGARSVKGLEFSPGRVQVATLLARILEAHDASPCPLDFQVCDVYDIGTQVKDVFDCSLVLGGLYHIADPPYVLDQVRKVTGAWMILQTSSVLPDKGNVASFRVRSDQTAQGLSSIRGGRGVWHFSAECLREFVHHAGFEIVEERQPERKLRKRYPWWCALARPIGESVGG